MSDFDEFCDFLEAPAVIEESGFGRLIIFGTFCKSTVLL